MENRLRQQQLQSEEDSKWLLQEENNLKKRLSITGSLGSDDLTGSNDNVASGSSSVEATKERPIVVKVCKKVIFLMCIHWRLHKLLTLMVNYRGQITFNQLLTLWEVRKYQSKFSRR